jgi:glyoxylase-like metal-dependent hydrolase (beta-lactamase superfamily II)
VEVELAGPDDRDPLEAAFELAGVDPRDVVGVCISHFHNDHVGGVRLFAGQCPIYLQRAEWELGMSTDPGELEAAAMFRIDFDDAHLDWRLLDGDTENAPGITAVLTAGHTPGHQSLRLRLAKTGALVLSGDAVHFRDNWDTPRAPVQNFDKDESIKSVNKLRRVAAANKAQVWINHDFAQTATLKKSPAYYD